MTDIINGKRVQGSVREIREVKNALLAYNLLPALVIIRNEKKL